MTDFEWYQNVWICILQNLRSWTAEDARTWSEAPRFKYYDGMLYHETPVWYLVPEIVSRERWDAAPYEQRNRLGLAIEREFMQRDLPRVFEPEYDWDDIRRAIDNIIDRYCPPVK